MKKNLVKVVEIIEEVKILVNQEKFQEAVDRILEIEDYTLTDNISDGVTIKDRCEVCKKSLDKDGIIEFSDETYYKIISLPKEYLIYELDKDIIEEELEYVMDEFDLWYDDNGKTCTKEFATSI